ncbi:DUF350 domain-containing protein [bacterium]|nr:DUF350 domain-containing protein [bacterium]
MVWLIGIISLVLSMVMGIVTIAIGFFFFGRITGNINEEEELLNNNIAVAILYASFIFALGYIMKEVIQPMIQTFFSIFYQFQIALTISKETVIKAAIYLPLQFLLTLIISIIVLSGSIRVFLWLTKNIDELKEIKKNNIAVAIVLASVIITIAMIVEIGLPKMLEVIIPTSPIHDKALSPFG